MNQTKKVLLYQLIQDILNVSRNIQNYYIDNYLVIQNIEIQCSGHKNKLNINVAQTRLCKYKQYIIHNYTNLCYIHINFYID